MGRFPNIAAAKAASGAARGKLYGTYAKEIYETAKNGGVTPEGNPSLKRLIEKAKKDQVPADVIKRAIDKVNSGIDESYIKNTYEMFGPAGSTLIVECLTDNVNRSVADLRAVVNKCHVKMGNMGSVSYNYDNLCIVSFKGLDCEQTLNLMIENDIDIVDIEEDNGNVIVYADPSNLFKIKDAISKSLPKVEFDMDEIAMLPKEKITLSLVSARPVNHL